MRRLDHSLGIVRGLSVFFGKRQSYLQYPTGWILVQFATLLWFPSVIISKIPHSKR